MNTVNLKINNIPVVAPEGATILEAWAAWCWPSTWPPPA